MLFFLLNSNVHCFHLLTLLLSFLLYFPSLRALFLPPTSFSHSFLPCFLSTLTCFVLLPMTPRLTCTLRLIVTLGPISLPLTLSSLLPSLLRFLAPGNVHAVSMYPPNEIKVFDFFKRRFEVKCDPVCSVILLFLFCLFVSLLFFG